MPPLLAEIMAEPALSPLASPPALTVAVRVLDDAQTTFEVMSRWVLSLRIAVAVNCAVVPAATCGLLGVTSIDWTVAPVAALPPAPPPPPEQAAKAVNIPRARQRASEWRVQIAERLRDMFWFLGSRGLAQYR
jgi:hypothetical protein